MRVFQANEESVTYVSEKIPRSDNLVFKVFALVVGGAVSISAIVVVGLVAVLLIAGLVGLSIIMKAAA